MVQIFLFYINVILVDNQDFIIKIFLSTVKSKNTSSEEDLVGQQFFIKQWILMYVLISFQ